MWRATLFKWVGVIDHLDVFRVSLVSTPANLLGLFSDSRPSPLPRRLDATRYGTLLDIHLCLSPNLDGKGNPIPACCRRAHEAHPPAPAARSAAKSPIETNWLAALAEYLVVRAMFRHAEQFIFGFIMLLLCRYEMRQRSLDSIFDTGRFPMAWQASVVLLILRSYTMVA